MKFFIIPIILLLLTLGFEGKAQVLISKNNEVTFFSKTPIEDISAINKTCTVAINTSTNDVAVSMLITGFDFPNKLMQEHFNENYLESDKIPKATFAGKITEKIDFSKSGTYPVTVTGKLNIHGISQVRTLRGVLLITGKSVGLMAEFDVKTADHKIDIPKLVFTKIAEVIKVSVKGNFLMP